MSTIYRINQRGNVLVNMRVLVESYGCLKTSGMDKYDGSSFGPYTTGCGYTDRHCYEAYMTSRVALDMEVTSCMQKLSDFYFHSAPWIKIWEDVYNITVSDDGVYLYTGDTSYVYQFQMSTPWDPNTISYMGSYPIWDLWDNDTRILGMKINYTGSKLYCYLYSSHSTFRRLATLKLLTPWSIASIDSTNIDYVDADVIATGNGAIWGLDVNKYATKMWTTDERLGKVFEYTFGTQGDITSLTQTSSIQLTVDEDGEDGWTYEYPEIRLSEDTSQIFFLSDRQVRQGTLATPGDITSLEQPVKLVYDIYTMSNSYRFEEYGIETINPTKGLAIAPDSDIVLVGGWVTPLDASGYPGILEITYDVSSPILTLISSEPHYENSMTQSAGAHIYSDDYFYMTDGIAWNYYKLSTIEDITTCVLQEAWDGLDFYAETNSKPILGIYARTSYFSAVIGSAATGYELWYVDISTYPSSWGDYEKVDVSTLADAPSEITSLSLELGSEQTLWLAGPNEDFLYEYALQYPGWVNTATFTKKIPVIGPVLDISMSSSGAFMLVLTANEEVFYVPLETLDDISTQGTPALLLNIPDFVAGSAMSDFSPTKIFQTSDVRNVYIQGYSSAPTNSLVTLQFKIDHVKGD